MPLNISFTSRRLHSTLTLLLVLFLLVSVCVDVASGAAVLRERQDAGVDGGEGGGTSIVVETGPVSTRDRPATVTGDSTALPSTTPTPARTDGKDDEKVVSETLTVSVRTRTATPSSAGSVPTMITGEDTEHDPDSVPAYSGVGLPIMPAVTPGIAVAGVLLMLAGFPLCLIGIKKKKVQIFLSVAYLGSLGVTVLIVYVMNPPVKDSVQGAYVVAATITGIFFGAVAVVFPEVTGTLGCLLGGFCLSMWFLVLKPGGLIENTYGKLIMIAVFCFAVFALAFHRITKPFALISATSFSGATSIVLGIDCFSKAGLKEFWLYIWDLNDSIFPLDTNTYPHTRGMRVEIAIILLLTALGIMSQIKLWKILRERRGQKRAEQQKASDDVEKLNEDVGKRVEEQDRQARAEWEKIYGNAEEPDKGNRPDSGVGSRTDSKISLTEDERKEVGVFVETESMKKERAQHIHMTRLQMEGKSAEGVTDIQPTEAAQEEQRLSTQPVGGGQHDEIEVEGRVQIQADEQSEIKVEQIEEEPKESPQPEVLPPPPAPILIRQHIPYIPDEENADEDIMSQATYADTISHTIHLSKLEEEQVIVEIVELNPRAIDEVSEEDIHVGQATQSDSALPKTEDNEELNVPSVEKPEGGDAVIEVAQPEDTEADPKIINSNEAVDERRISSIASEEPKKTSIISGGRKISSITSGEQTNSSPASLADLGNIQNHCSRIHKTYRTNEWAKHLADAEAVELDDLTASPYAVEDIPEEIPAPVLVAELQRTAIPEPKSSSAVSRTSSYGQSQGNLAPKDPTPLSFVVAATIPVPAPALPPPLTPPQPVVISAPSRISLRRSSIPVIPEGAVPGVEKPSVQQLTPPAQQLTPPAHPSRAMSPMPQASYENTLIGRRESMLKLKPSLLAHEQMVRSATPSGFHTHNPVLAADATPVHNMNLHRSSNIDDMTLAERRELLLNQQQASRAHTPIPHLSPRNSFGISPPSPTFANVKKQNILLHSWRESLKQDPSISQQSQALRTERMTLDALNEKQQATIFKKEKQAEKAQREGLIEERMRMPDMLNAHREAIRRLQAGASTQ